MILTLWFMYINSRLYRLNKPTGDFQLSWNEIITVFLSILLIKIFKKYISVSSSIFMQFSNVSVGNVYEKGIS